MNINAIKKQATTLNEKQIVLIKGGGCNVPSVTCCIIIDMDVI